MGEANLLAMWSHPDSPEPITTDQRIGIERGYHKRLKFQAMRFTNIETLPYAFHQFKFQRNIYVQPRLTTRDAGRFPSTHTALRVMNHNLPVCFHHCSLQN